ncbi:hypothetical protein DL768_009387 [Monosporascus sp. mg162]|nr:hypothetical protein DL768_009387 [Monosporascus sp. mg162]
MGSVEDVEFKTVDGITLRGRIYHANQRGPAVVMCPGFNGVKELGGLPAVAEAFQAAGITTLVYDPRSVGMSDGLPRNDIDPFQQVQDYSDALTFLTALPTIDRHQIGLWGISLSASVALSAAAFDKRAKLVIAACPVTEYHYNEAKMHRLLQACFKDRESQIKGNPPFYIPMVDDSGDSPAGLDFGSDRERAAEWARRGVELAAHHVRARLAQRLQPQFRCMSDAKGQKWRLGGELGSTQKGLREAWRHKVANLEIEISPFTDQFLNDTFTPRKDGSV